MIVLQPIGKYVAPDGKLLSSSASAITTFDSTTPFGCERKSWFEVRAGLKGAPTKSLEMGDLIHKQIEHYLKTGQDALGKEARAGKGIIDEIVKKYPYFQIEQWIESFEIDGVKLRGKIDFIGREVGGEAIKSIIDWKTSSDIQKWGKTSSMLRKDTQMLIYRAAAEAEGCDETLEMQHVYFGTVKRESEPVRTTINRQQLADGIGDITSKLSRMKSVMQITDSEEVTPDRTKCKSCPFNAHCPDKGTFSFMSSLTDRFKKSAPAVVDPSPTPILGMNTPGIPDATPTAPQASRVVEETLATEPARRLYQVMEMMKAGKITQEQGNRLLDLPVVKGENNSLRMPSVLPPDAPKSNPALAALPVEGFSPIPAPQVREMSAPPVPTPPAVEAPKRGRPKKLQVDAEAPTPPAAPPVEVSADFEVTEVMVMVGATVKAVPNDPKCFEFIKVDVSLKAQVKKGANIISVRAKLAEMAHEGLVQEIEARLPK